MALRYYIQAGVATSVIDDSDAPLLEAPWVEVSQGDYETELAEFLKSVGYLSLQVTRSTVRLNPVGLQDYTLDDGRSYAVFLGGIGGLSISQVQFDLDGSAFNTEFSAPWDFNGTDVGGEALKYVFSLGVHEIDAHITHAGGVITVTGTFEVD